MPIQPWRLKARWFLSASWRQFTKAITSPLREKLGLAHLGAYGLLLFGAFQLGGLAGVLDELSTKAAVIWTAISTVPVFVVGNLISAPFKARAEAKKEGGWHGDEFIYNAPVLIYTRRVFAADHGAVIPFKVPGVPGAGYVTYKIEFHPPNPYWSATLGGRYSEFNPQIREAQTEPGGGTRIGDNRSSALIVWASRDDVASAIVKVWMHSWHAGAVPL